MCGLSQMLHKHALHGDASQPWQSHGEMEDVVRFLFGTKPQCSIVLNPSLLWISVPSHLRLSHLNYHLPKLGRLLTVHMCIPSKVGIFIHLPANVNTNGVFTWKKLYGFCCKDCDSSRELNCTQVRTESCQVQACPVSAPSFRIRSRFITLLKQCTLGVALGTESGWISPKDSWCWSIFPVSERSGCAGNDEFI